MSLAITCHSCGTKFLASDSFAGQKLLCPTCGLATAFSDTQAAVSTGSPIRQGSAVSVSCSTCLTRFRANNMDDRQLGRPCGWQNLADYKTKKRGQGTYRRAVSLTE
jgi:hypothetical protein